MAFDELKSPFFTDCDLSKKCHTPEIKPIGPEKADIYILGEAPSERDDLIGKPFSGQGGEIFRTILEHLKIGPAKVRFGNAIQCKADKEGPTDIQINMCRKRVFADIKKAKPKVIIAMGNAAIKSLLNRSEPGVHGWRGNIVPLHDLNCWVVPVFPMSKILKDGVSDNKIQWTKGTNYTDSLKVLREDLSIVRDLTTVPLPKIKPFKIIKLLTYQAVTSFFDMADNKDFFMFDIETIGLKPYFEHSKILTSAVTFDGETVYAFPISYHTHIDKKKYWTDEQEKQIKSRFSDLLTNKRSRKGIHNSVFEMEWAKAILNIDIVNIEDSMLQKYILDCRNGTHSLDFLAFVNYGVSWKTYPDSIMADLTQLSIEELLDYNAKDSIWEYRLFKKQEKILEKDEKLNNCYREQLETARTIAQMQFDGACTNEESRDKLLKGYVIEREGIEKELLSLDSVIEFKNKYGKVPALKSNSKDIPIILFQIENLDSVKRKHPEIRQIIVAPDGYVLIIFDYAQLEARVLAALSNCRKLIDAIKTGYDIHMVKTIEIWGEEVIKNATPKAVKLMRYRAKNEFVFPSFYGAKPPATAKRLGISESKAEMLLEKLWFDFPEILEWQQEILKIYEKKRYVEIPPGRRRYAPLTTNEILNTPVQGGAASIVSKVMNKISRRGYWLYLNCHDELVFAVKEKEVKYAIEEIQGIMESKVYDFMGDTPLVVEGSIGFDWYEIFPIKEIFE